MREFIKNYIDVFDCMGTSSEEKIDTIIDLVEVLKDKDKNEIFSHIIRPLLIEYRDTSDENTSDDIENLFIQLLGII